MTGNEFKNRIVTLSPRLYPMVARMLQSDEDAQDAIQEIMIKLWKHRNKLDNHPILSGYVFLTARNHCLDIIKGRKPMVTLGNEYELNYNIDKEFNAYEEKESYTIVKQIIEELPENQKKVVVLRDIDGLEFDEIQMITGEKIENLRVHLSRARKKIGKKLTEIYEYEYGKGR